MRRYLFRIPPVGLFHHTAGKGHERLSRLAPVIQYFGRTVVTILANALHDGNLSQQRHVHLFGKAFHPFFPEQVVSVLRQLGRSEPCHVFHQPKDGDIHFLVLVHVDAFARIGQRHFLRRADNDSTGNR